MTETLYYSKSPLTEAVIDIRVQPAEGMSPDALSQIWPSVVKQYTHREERIEVIGEIPAALDAPPAKITRTHIGYVFFTADRQQSFQARIDGFTFSRLAPYTGWAEFSSEARRLWDIYREIAKPLTITRIAVRYINRLDLPLPIEDFKEYIRTVPEIAPGLPQSLSGFFLQLHIPQEDEQWMLIINETIVENPNSDDAVSIILDIDLFQDENTPSDESSIWSLLNQFRERKNNVFRACITEKMERLIR